LADQVYHAARDNVAANVPGYGAMQDDQTAPGRIGQTTKQLGSKYRRWTARLRLGFLGRSPAARSATQKLMQCAPRLRAALAGGAAAPCVPRGFVRRLTEGVAGDAGAVHGASLLHTAGLVAAFAAASIVFGSPSRCA
jgi:hypothetical protein